jgi:hypothetical protein
MQSTMGLMKITAFATAARTRVMICKTPSENHVRKHEKALKQLESIPIRAHLIMPTCVTRHTHVKMKNMLSKEQLETIPPQTLMLACTKPP